MASSVIGPAISGGAQQQPFLGIPRRQQQERERKQQHLRLRLQRPERERGRAVHAFPVSILSCRYAAAGSALERRGTTERTSAATEGLSAGNTKILFILCW